MLSNNVYKCLMLITTLSVSSVTYAQSDNKEDQIQELMDGVPSSVMEQKKEIRDLKHLKQKYKLIAEIDGSISEINSKSGSSSNPKPEVLGGEMTDLESIISNQLLLDSSRKNSSSSGNTRKASTFIYQVSLLAIWGAENNPRADIIFNGRQLEIGKGSSLNGWKVKNISRDYLTLSKGESTNKVYYKEPEVTE